MMSSTPRTVAIAMTLVASGSPLAAQNGGSVKGTVTNAQTRAPIHRARVAIAHPERIAITDNHGAYVLRDLPVGSYTVLTTAIGRAPDSATVVVAAGGSATYDVALREGSLLLSGMIVSATRSPIEASKVASTVNVITPEQV